MIYVILALLKLSSQLSRKNQILSKDKELFKILKSLD